MSQQSDLDAVENHPLALELASLRSAVARFQDESHNAAIKFQRRSLSASNNNDRLSSLERENEALSAEVAVLRAHPHPDAYSEAHPAAEQIRQLTLSLRRLSIQLAETENALMEKTTELVHARAEAGSAKLAAEGAYELAARIRGREEARRVREMELERKVRAAEEAAKMSDLVVKEYADLVRSLEARGRDLSTRNGDDASVQTVSSSTALSDQLSEGKMGLKTLLSDFTTETEKLEAEVARLQGELEAAESKTSSEKKAAEQVRLELAKAQFELQKLKFDDSTATKTVSRYMKFSQISTNNLQEAMTSLKARQAATVETLSTQLSQLSSKLRSSEHDAEKLRDALDDLGGEIMKETFGRRREVALRLRVLSREERLREGLDRWILRAEEAIRQDGQDAHGVCQKMIRDAHHILSSSLDNSVNVEAAASASLARVIAAQGAVEALLKELDVETTRRVRLEKLLAQKAKTFTMDVPVELKQPLLVNGMSRAGVTDSETSSMKTTSQLSFSPVPPYEPDTSQATQASKSALVSSLSSGVDLSSMASSDEPRVDGKGFRGQIIQLNGEALHDKPLPEIVDEHTKKDVEMINGLPVDARSRSPVLSTDSSILKETKPDFAAPASNGEIKGQSDAERNNPANVLATPQFEVPLLTAESLSEGQDALIHASGRPASMSALATQNITGISEYLEPNIAQSDEVAPMEQELSPMATVLVGLPSSVTATEGDDDVPSALPKPHDGVPESVHNPSDTSQTSTTSEPAQPQRHPLLDRLKEVSHRYDSLQRSFRDCHLALEALTSSISSSGSLDFPGQNIAIPADALRTALGRLNDYTEDARVELEIRVADEALMTRGFETLLSVPGAISVPGTFQHLSNALEDDVNDSPTLTEVESQVESFISGADSSVQKAQQSFTRKLEDIQHDVAILKRAIHDGILSPAPATPDTAPAVVSGNGGNGWSSWIRSSPSLPVNSPPRSSGPAPTFGNIMTTPRLRHSPSLNFVGSAKRTAVPEDPLAHLGFRVPMPAYVPVAQAQQRSRTVSTMYMLGLGARQPSTSSFASPSRSVPNRPTHLNLDDTSEEDNPTSSDEDVE